MRFNPTALISRPKKLQLFEKEKGGVGSTGTLATVAHMLMLKDEPVVFIEASTSQSDISNAYQHHEVHAIDLTTDDARLHLIDVIDKAPEGANILVNVPGGRFPELYVVHKFIDYVVHEEQALDVDVSIIWTMGLDAASRVTLDTLLDSKPPGRVLLNLPGWHGNPETFDVDDELIARIEATGGTWFVTPALDSFLYDMFRKDEIAIDRLRDQKGLTFGGRMVLSQWEKLIFKALEGIF